MATPPSCRDGRPFPAKTVLSADYCQLTCAIAKAKIQGKNKMDIDSNNNSVSPFHSNLFPTCESNLEESYCFCYVPENKYALCLFTDKKIGIGRLTNVVKPIIPPGENERANLVKELQEKKILVIIR